MDNLLGLLEDVEDFFEPGQPAETDSGGGRSDQYVPDGVWLMCDKGTVPGKLKLLPRTVQLYNENIALETDLLPFVNIPSFVACAIKISCTPVPVKWLDVMEDGVNVNGVRPLLDSSKCQCGVGGKISIYLTFGSMLSKVGNFLTEVGDVLAEASFWCEVGAAVLGVAGVISVFTGVGAVAAPFLFAAAGGLAEAGAVLAEASAVATVAGGLLTAGGEFMDNPDVESGKALVGAVWDAFGDAITRRFMRKTGSGRVGLTPVPPGGRGGGSGGGRPPARRNIDPPGTYRDSKGKLRDSKTNRYVKDPNRVPSKRKKGDEYPRNIKERKRALLRDADDPNSDLTPEARAHIKRTNGNSVPDGYEVSHEEPLYTRTTHKGKAELDKAGNMKTQKKETHRARHEKCGDQYHEYGPTNKPNDPKP